MKNNRLSPIIFLLSICFIIMFSDAVFANDMVIPPRIVISKYEVSSGAVIPGSEFELMLTLKNTSDKDDVYSVLLTGRDNNGLIEPVYGGTNQQYVDKIPAGKEKVVTFKLMLASRATTDKISYTINREFVDKQNGQYNNDAIINIPVKKNLSMKIQNYVIPKVVQVDKSTKINITYENNSNNRLSNIVLTVSGSGIEKQTINLDDLSPNTVAYKDVSVEFDKIGKQTVNMSISYVDIDGITYEVEIGDYPLEVSKDITQAEVILDSNEDDRKGKKLIAFSVGLIVMTVIIFVTIKLERTNNKR